MNSDPVLDIATGSDAGKVENTKSPFQLIYQALEKKFIFVKRIAQAIALAHTAKMNLLLWGPGGHGKSTMVETALTAIGVWDNTFLQSFDAGMDEARLWGGLDLKALDEERIMQFYAERAFLVKDVAVFEEIFDAPRPVLLALKDTLTRGWFMNGAQRVQMKTGLVIACTNKDPREFAGQEDAYKALLERFPLQLQVAWDKYDDASYSKLYKKTLPSDLSYREDFIRVLANLMASLSEPPFAVSPRIAVAAAQAVMHSPETMGRKQIVSDDFLSILLIQGLENYTNDLQARIRKAVDTYGVPFAIQNIRNALTQLEKKAQATVDPDRIVELMKQGNELEARLASIRSVPNSADDIALLTRRIQTFLTSRPKEST